MTYNFELKHEENSRAAILLFHGLTGSPYELKKFGQYLHSLGFDVYAGSLPGHGDDFENIRSTRYRDWLAFAYDNFEKLSCEYEEVFVGGLCLGALLALAVAQKYNDRVNGIISLSTTLFLDGTRTPWYHFLSPLGYHTIARYFYNFPEGEPYGVKNTKVRGIIKRLIEKNEVGLDNYPMSCIYELVRLSALIRKNFNSIFAPILIIHSKEDDLTSTKSAYAVYNNVSSEDKTLIILNDSYHMVLYDNEREYVFDLCEKFLKEHSKVKEASLC